MSIFILQTEVETYENEFTVFCRKRKHKRRTEMCIRDRYRREIEFSVGLAYGDLSDVQEVAKTATEIKASKNRKYNRVTAIQSNLQECLEDFAAGLAFYNSMLNSCLLYTSRCV